MLCGVQSSDGVNAATGTALAGLPGLPRVAVVKQIEDDGGAATVERELEGGLIERVRVPLPALLTVQTGINEPRYVTLRGISQASAKPMEVRYGRTRSSRARGWSALPPPPGRGRGDARRRRREIAARIATIIKSRWR